jgi:DNA-binding LacI/PurR family transcriptional regulator
MTATVREVARRAGVSPMTVSRVVNGSGRVRPETRLAVERVIAAVGYVPNGLARALTSRKTGVVGLMTATVREVARRAGVTPMTVTRVVNGSGRVRPETRLAVERVIAAVGYVPNGLARALTSR